MFLLIFVFLFVIFHSIVFYLYRYYYRYFWTWWTQVSKPTTKLVSSQHTNKTWKTCAPLAWLIMPCPFPMHEPRPLPFSSLHLHYTTPYPLTPLRDKDLRKRFLGPDGSFDDFSCLKHTYTWETWTWSEALALLFSKLTHARKVWGGTDWKMALQRRRQWTIAPVARVFLHQVVRLCGHENDEWTLAWLCMRVARWEFALSKVEDE